MGYDLKGRMVEVCSCKSLCPCAVGQDPDGGSCGFNWVFHFDAGQINGTDVTGLNLGVLGNHEGNVFKGDVRIFVVVDERADDAQQAALLDAFTGKAGGPLADLAGLVREVVGLSRAAITFDMDKGTGSCAVDGVFEAEVKGYTGADGSPTTLNNFVAGGALGDPAYPGLPTHHRVIHAEHGLRFKGNQATQYDFHHVAS